MDIKRMLTRFAIASFPSSGNDVFPGHESLHITALLPPPPHHELRSDGKEWIE